MTSSENYIYMFIIFIFQILLTQLDMTTSMLQIVEMKIVKVKISSYYRFYLKCLFVCLKLPEQFFSYWVAVTISSDRQGCRRSSLSIYANMGFSSYGSFKCQTCCDSGIQFGKDDQVCIHCFNCCSTWVKSMKQ